MDNSKVMLDDKTPWEHFSSPEKRENVFCRLGFVFGLVFVYAGVALTVIGWMNGTHITDPYPYKVAGYTCLGVSVAVFLLFMTLSCTSHRICLCCDTDEQDARPIGSETSSYQGSIDKARKSSWRHVKVAPIQQWGEGGHHTVMSSWPHSKVSPIMQWEEGGHLTIVDLS